MGDDVLLKYVIALFIIKIMSYIQLILPGGIYAYKDIAFEFSSWVFPKFKVYLIKEFERYNKRKFNS